MSYIAACAIIALSALLGAVAPFLVRRRISVETLRRHHEVGSYVFLQMGVIYAVLLAFVFTEVWSGYTAAAFAVRVEASNLVSAARLARGLPKDQADGVQNAIANYLKTTIHEGWPAMAEGEQSDAANKAFAWLWSDTRGIVVGSGDYAILASQIFNRLDDANKARDERLFQMSNHVPMMLWTLLSTYAFVLLAFLLFFGVENVWSQAFFTGAFAGGIAFMIVVIAVLDFPFAGALRLSPQPMVQALEKVVQDHENR
jgi:ABC-type multidrug transport system fused ATPase/permease subunit